MTASYLASGSAEVCSVVRAVYCGSADADTVAPGLGVSDVRPSLIVESGARVTTIVAVAAPPRSSKITDAASMRPRRERGRENFMEGSPVWPRAGFRISV